MILITRGYSNPKDVLVDLLNENVSQFETAKEPECAKVAFAPLPMRIYKRNNKMMG